jgi:PhzF family phenazine biosynthesis protein
MSAGIPIYQVDAFTGTLFRGNPAAVCLPGHWLPEALMQSIASENNLSETAFVVPQGDVWEIRWFTPTVEVDLCGHATLASAFVLFEFVGIDAEAIDFHSPRSGALRVFRREGLLWLDFPTDTLEPSESMDSIEAGIGLRPQALFRGRSDYLAVLDSEDELLCVQPDFDAIAGLDARGLIVTAPGKTCDFISRFFAPQSGVNEDPVTGSAHTTLTPFWAGRLGRQTLNARQLSARGGELLCELRESRVWIGGEAKLYLRGEIYLE